MKSFAKFSCLTFLLINCLLTGQCCSRKHSARSTNIAIRRNIAKPYVEAFTPAGLRVSIPDFPGMELFAFHANINAPMKRPEAGALSQDISHPKDGRWTFEDKTLRLRVGDVINYWIFAQVSGVGYRVDNLSEIIKELIPSANLDEAVRMPLVLSDDPSIHCKESSTVKPQVCLECNCQSDQLNAMSNQLSSTLTQLHDTQMKVEPLQKEIENLKNLLAEITNDLNIGTKLLLSGQQPPLGNPLEAIRNLIIDKLELLDLDERIVSAQRTENGIVFEVKSSLDKKRILLRARKQLEKSNYKIVDPQDPQTFINGQYLLDERTGSSIVTRQ